MFREPLLMLSFDKKEFFKSLKVHLARVAEVHCRAWVQSYMEELDQHIYRKDQRCPTFQRGGWGYATVKFNLFYQMLL